MEETLCVVKPDGVRAGLADAILASAEADGFYVVRRVETRLTPARARDFYAHLEGTPAFRAASEHLASGPVVAAVLSKVDGVRAWLDRVGPSDPILARETHPSSLRARHGEDTLRNAVHASATVRDAARERAHIFPTAPLPSLVPKEYLLETLVLPGLVEALGELYLAQPEDPYEWMAHWFATAPPPNPRTVNAPWPTPALGPADALEEAASEACHDRAALGRAMYPGTWNFRRCRDRDPVYGAGVGDAGGLRAILEGLRDSGHESIAWVLLADEPVVFLEGDPMVVAERKAAGGRASVRGALDRSDEPRVDDLERRERRLKSDVVAAARASGRDAVLVAPPPDARGERGPPALRALGEDFYRGLSDDDRVAAGVGVGDAHKKSSALTKTNPGGGAFPDGGAEGSLLTPDEVFAGFAAARLPVRYARVPIPEEGAPSERALERLADACAAAARDPTAALAFACRDGRARATVGMVAGCLAWGAREGAYDADASTKRSRTVDPRRPNYDLCEFKPVLDLVASLDALEREAPGAGGSASEAEAEAGAGAEAPPPPRVGVSSSLGSRAKAALDDAAAKCDALADVRGEANRWRIAAEDAEAAGSIPGGGAHGRAGAAEAARRGTLALERYCWLLFFAAYCLEEGPGDFRRRFTAWSRARWRARPRARDMVLR